MPNGEYEEQFNKKLAEWEAQTKLYVEQTKTAQTQLEDLTKQLTEASTQFIPPSAPPKIIGPVEFVSPAMSELLKKAEYAVATAPEIQLIKDDITRVSAELERYDFFARLYNEVPAAIAAGAVYGADGVLTKLIPPGDLTTTELEEVRATISDMVAVITGRRAEAEPGFAEAEGLPEEAARPELVAPSIPSIYPVGIHLLSTQELVKALRAPVIPEGTISEADWRAYLKEQGWSDEDIDKEQQYDAEMLIQDWEERNNRLAAFRAGLAEMPDYTAADMLKELAVQPGLFLMEIAGYYFEHVTMPLAGTIYGVFIPDIQKEYIAYKKANPNASYWEGMSHAWRAWDAPFSGAAEWILKYVLLEGLVDPLTYIGWGIATKVTRPLGSFGRLIAMAERGVMEVLEAPFDLIKAIWHGLPKTLVQRATMHTARGTALVKRYITAAARRPLSFIGMDDLTDVVQRGIKYTLTHPQVDDTITVAGREMLRHAPVDEALVRRWSTALGTTLGPDDITRVTIQSVDDIFEDYFWRGAVGREIITQDEAARQLLGILHVQNTSDDILKAAGSILERRSDAIIKAAGAFTAETNSLAAMRVLSRKNLTTYTTIEKSAAALARRDVGRLSTLLHGVSGKLQAIWVNKIDKYLVRPTAEAYLTFGMYGPMNVLEDYWRSVLGGVIPRKATIEDIQMVGTGLVYDVNLERAGLSEMLGPTRRLGSESTWNNWILQLGGLADNWGAKLYKALVEVPGGWGMDVRRNFVLRKYMQLLGETGGDAVQALLKLKATLPDLADSAIVKELEATTRRAALTGRLHTTNPDFVDMIRNRFTRKKIVRNEVSNVLREHPDVSNVVRDHVMRNYDAGTLLRSADDIERVVGKEARDLALDEFIRGPEMAVENFRQLKDFLIDLNVRNPEEMATAIQALYKMSEVYGALPEQIIAQATVRSRGLPITARRATFDADFDRIAIFLDRAGLSMDDVITNLRKRMVEAGLPDNYSDAAGRLFDIMTAKREYATEFRAQNIVTRREIFQGATPTQLKTPEFWDDFYTQMSGEYHILNVRMAELDALMANAIEGLNTAAGVRLPSRAPVVIRERPLAAQDVALLLGVRGDDISRALLDVLTVQNNKDFFIAYVMGKVRPGVDVGFTREAVGAVYDQIAYSLKVSPQAMSWISGQQLEIDAMRKEFHSLMNSKLLPDSEIAAIGKYIDDMAEQVERLMYKDGKLVPGFAKYDDLRQSAMDEAHKWYYKEYPDYTNANAFDAMMKVIYPYWTYESQRWFWLPRSFVRHPGTFTAFERWQNNSDYGYIHIPGTSIDINPFRGTIYGAMTTRLTRRDFPEYYDSLGGTKGLVEFSDFLSRFGFYPGAHIGVPLALMGGLEQQMGETIPAIWKTPLNALIAIAPESGAVKWLSDHLFSDRFRDYLTILEVNRRGYNGSHLWSKVREDIALTEEEQAIWDESRGEAALYSTLFEQTGLFRLRTEEQYEAYEQSAIVIEELTGYTKDQQDWLRRHGYRIWDIVGGLSPTHQAILQEMETYKWVGTITPLLPSRQQAELRRLDLDWDEVLQYTEANQAEKLQLQQDLLTGKLGPRDYNDRLQSLYIDQRSYIDKKVEANPNMTLEGRLEYYKKYQVPIPVQHPMRELLNMYFSIELEDIYDKETGELRADWDTFFARRAAIESAIPENLLQEWESYISRNSTKMEKVRRDVYDKYFRKYYNVWDKVLSTYPDEEQTLINEYLYLERTGQKLERQAAIKAHISAKTDNMLISSFRSEVSANRQALRYANPTLDAWLYFWGRITTFLTPQAEAIYHQLAKDTGRTIE